MTMIEVLVVDDNPHKIKLLRNTFESMAEVSNCDIATDAVTAQSYLNNKHYDLLILDLNIPKRIGDESLPQNGIDFLRILNSSTRLTKPASIIGLTEYDDNIQRFQNEFQQKLWLLIKYQPDSNEWEKQIKARASYLIQSKRGLQSLSQASFQYDLAIITALRATEFDSVLGLEGDWQLTKIPNDSSEYYSGIFRRGTKQIKVIASFAPQMGMVAAAVLTMKMISSFRPKYVAMTGISAGIRGNNNLGDILIADLSFDCGSGKTKTGPNGEEIFEPDYRTIALSTDLRDEILSCQGSRHYLDEIKQKWPSNKPSTELNIHIGPFATGANVIQNVSVVNDIQGHARKLIGLDMEAYGVFYAANNCTKPRPRGVLSIKSVCDFADNEKNDSYQKYAAYTSASFLYNFALDKIDFE